MPAKKKRARKKTGATRKAEQKNSFLSWAVMAVLLAAFVAFLIHLDQLPEQGKNAPIVIKSGADKKPDRKTPVKPKQEFDFYTVLPDREVEVIKPEKTRVQVKPKSKLQVNQHSKTVKTNTASRQLPSNQLYQLQVGAFKELNKADAMKARLAFLGVESNIQVIRNNNQPMYRVRVGPGTDYKKMEQVKAQLKAQNINTFMQKL